jgi:NAD-dependent SIR2 family protein deacetylase
MTFHWKRLQAGHYFHNKLDFDRRNLRPQCPRCNKWLRGNLAVYGVRLTKELGVKGMDQLMKDANTVTYSTMDLHKIIDECKEELSHNPLYE